MEAIETRVEEPVRPGRHDAVRSQIRGSMLLLSGRFLSRALNLVVQVVTVRFLTKADYGDLAYALSIVTLLQKIATFGLDRSVSRFLPMYEEHKEYGKLLGTLLLVIGTCLALGTAAPFALRAFPELFSGWLGTDTAQGYSLILLLAFLAPVQALDEVLVGLFAVFASPGAIFFRKHVLAPGLKLMVVTIVLLARGDVMNVAVGYMIASAVGLLICMAILWRLMARRGVLLHLKENRIEVPWKEVLSFTIPLLSSELVVTVMHTMDAIVLRRCGTIEQVAELRAVQPIALMNQLVMASFATLFTTAAARMFARKDHKGINELYWQTTAWIAVLSFPLFLATSSIAEPVTLMLFGGRYQQSAVLLSILSIGTFFNAALGLNGLTLKVCGKLKYVFFLNLLTAILDLALILVLIPRYGALGAAIANCLALIVHNIFKQTGLRLGTGIHLFETRFLRIYLSIVSGTILVWVVQWASDPPLWASVAIAGLVSLIVLRVNRKVLDAAHTLPELLRVPLMPWLLGSQVNK